MGEKPGSELLEDHGHSVLLYGHDEGLLTQVVASHVTAGFERGETVLIVATRDHRHAFSAALAMRGVDLDAAATNGRLLVMDAGEALAKFMVDGRPDRTLFDETIGTHVRRIVRLSGTPVCAYGEMVGLLWSERQFEAAARLEQLWNELLDDADCGLLCAYPIDVLGDEFQITSVDPIMCSHSRLVPTGHDRRLKEALDRGMDRVLGESAAQIRPLVKPNHRPAWGSMPEAEATILWLRNNLPAHTDEIIEAAKAYFQVS